MKSSQNELLGPPGGLMEEGVQYNTYRVHGVAQSVFFGIATEKTHLFLFFFVSVCVTRVYITKICNYVLAEDCNFLYLYNYVFPTYIPALENLIKHSCSHGLFLLIAKALLTDCNINRNFPVGRRKSKILGNQD